MNEKDNLKAQVSEEDLLGEGVRGVEMKLVDVSSTGKGKCKGQGCKCGSKKEQAQPKKCGCGSGGGSCKSGGCKCQPMGKCSCSKGQPSKAQSRCKCERSGDGAKGKCGCHGHRCASKDGFADSKSKHELIHNPNVRMGLAVLATVDMTLKAVAITTALKRGDKKWVLPLALVNSVGVLPTFYLVTRR